MSKASASVPNDDQPDTSVTLYREKPPFPSLHDNVYAALRQALMTGDLVPGQAVSIRTLAEAFDASLIPTRDAIKRLVAERALTVLPNRAVVVAKMSRRRFQEILNVRLCVEPMLARHASINITPAEIAKLEGINDEMQAAVEADNVKTYLICNQRFHFELYAAAESTVMHPIAESLWMQVGPFLNGVFTQSGTRNAKDNHSEVLKALRRGDHGDVALAIRRDLADAADTVLAQNKFVEEGT